ALAIPLGIGRPTGRATPSLGRGVRDALPISRVVPCQRADIDIQGHRAGIPKFLLHGLRNTTTWSCSSTRHIAWKGARTAHAPQCGPSEFTHVPCTFESGDLLRLEVEALDQVDPDRAFLGDHFLEVGAIAGALVDAEGVEDLLDRRRLAALDHHVGKL